VAAATTVAAVVAVVAVAAVAAAAVTAVAAVALVPNKKVALVARVRGKTLPLVEFLGMPGGGGPAGQVALGRGAQPPQRLLRVRAHDKFKLQVWCLKRPY
jgi:hypothetical protein